MSIEVIKQKIKEISALLDELDCDSKENNLSIPPGFFMGTRQNSKDLVTHDPYDDKVGNNRWMAETINDAYFSVNAWGFGGIAGGTQELQGAFIEILESRGRLMMQWFVGGYWRDFNGRPEHGWWTKHKGGNDVKGYPRLGIGSASGQEVATVGAPFNVPSKVTDGWTHVDQDQIRVRCGIPAPIKDAPPIKLKVDYELRSDFLPGEDSYGNYFAAVDSYLHDVQDLSKISTPALKGSINAINDTSGSIYGQDMKELKGTTKEWAIMVWLHRSRFFETSGGLEIGRKRIGDYNYIIKYKIETASDKKFKYLAFIRDLDPGSINKTEVYYNEIAEFYTSKEMQDIFIAAGPLEDVDGAKRLIQAPRPTLILSDVNFGIEVLSNPDTQDDTSKRPVIAEFKELSFNVEGYGAFGYKGD